MPRERCEKLKAWNARRREIAYENTLAIVRALDAIRSENIRRREGKGLAKAASKGQPETPGIVAVLASLFLPDSCAAVVLGDLAETYPILKRKRGAFRAYFEVHKQIIFSIWPIVSQAIRSGDAGWLLRRMLWAGLTIAIALLIHTLASQGGLDGVGADSLDPLGLPFGISW